MSQLCTCGCKQPISDKHLFRYRPPFLLRGHRFETPLCKCGCGERIKWSPNLRYQNRKGFLKGHATRSHAQSQLCECDCGQQTTVRHGATRRFVTGHNNRGRTWGKGRYTQGGYVFIHVGRGRYVGEHRLVMEKAMGRKLACHEPVHHINGKRSDNRLENLELMNRSEHGKKHGRPKGSYYSTLERARQSERMKRWWAERKAKH